MVVKTRFITNQIFETILSHQLSFVKYEVLFDSATTSFYKNRVALKFCFDFDKFRIIEPFTDEIKLHK